MKIIIVGAGVSGLFCSLYLAKHKNIEVILLDKGKSAKYRDGISIIGVGGAGGFFDGKQHFSRVLSHAKLDQLIDSVKCQDLIEEVESIFTSFGVNEPYYPKDSARAAYLRSNINKYGVELYIRKLRHLGSDKTSRVTKNMEDHLITHGVDLRVESEVENVLVSNSRAQGVVKTDGEVINSDAVVVAPGRSGVPWLQGIARDFDLEMHDASIEIGFRLEMPTTIISSYTNLLYDPIFTLIAPTSGRLVRTFCTCPNGIVQVESHPKFITVNGGSCVTCPTNRTNFALLTVLQRSELISSPTTYGLELATSISKQTGNRAMIQKLGDYISQKPSNIKDLDIIFLANDFVVSDINVILPHDLNTDLKEAIEILGNAIPGISSPDNILYAPEIKFRGMRIATNAKLQSTTINNLYFCGDGPGLSGNIVGAASTGLIVGHELAELAC